MEQTRPEWFLELQGEYQPQWNYPGYIVYQQLLDTRHWTPALVDQFMPDADLIEPNPHNSFQVMRLYALPRVFAVEKTHQFKLALLKAHQSHISPIKYCSAARKLQHQTNQTNQQRRWKNKNRNSR